MAPEPQEWPGDRVVRTEKGNLTRLPEVHDPVASTEAAEAISGARRILVMGARASVPVAAHRPSVLDKLGFDVAPSLNCGCRCDGRLGRMDSRDCIVVIGFPRYRLSDFIESTWRMP